MCWAGALSLMNTPVNTWVPIISGLCRTMCECSVHIPLSAIKIFPLPGVLSGPQAAELVPDVLHWPVYPCCLSSAVRVLIISCSPRLITSYQTSRSVSCCAFLLSCIGILPHWPGILTWLWIWGTSYFGEFQISLLGTCCCPSTEFAVIFPSFLSSSPLPSIQRTLSPFTPPPFF